MELYKCKQQVMAQCNYRNDCDGTYNSTDCMCYRDNKILMPDTADKVKIKSLQAKYEQLQKKYNQAMELLGLAEHDINGCTVCAYYEPLKQGRLATNCKKFNFKGLKNKCGNFRWQHADKLEELMGGNADEM